MVYVEVAVWLVFAGALLWLRHSVTESVRAGTEKALADYRHEHAQQLAEITAALQRRGAEFGLFKEKQYAVYGKLYAHARKTSALYTNLADIEVGFYEGDDFSQYRKDQVERYLERRNISKDQGRDALAAVTKGDPPALKAAMERLHALANRRDARVAFERMKTYEAITELYTSDATRAAMKMVIHAVAGVSVVVEEDDHDGDREWKKKLRQHRDEMRAAVVALLDVLRAEVHRGDREKEATAPSPTKPN